MLKMRLQYKNNKITEQVSDVLYNVELTQFLNITTQVCGEVRLKVKDNTYNEPLNQIRNKLGSSVRLNIHRKINNTIPPNILVF